MFWGHTCEIESRSVSWLFVKIVWSKQKVVRGKKLEVGLNLKFDHLANLFCRIFIVNPINVYPTSLLPE